MQEIKERLFFLQGEVEKSLSHLELSVKKEALLALEKEMSAEGFWNNQERAQKISREAGELRSLIEAWEGLSKGVASLLELAELLEAEPDAESMAELQEDLEFLEKNHAALSKELYMNGPYDGGSAILSFSAGAGGTDAQDFAEMLLRMYLRYCERRGWKATQLDVTPGAEAGIKSASIRVDGPFAYGYLKHENGVHRLVRLSPFNSGSTRETSFAMVEVMPQIEEENIEIKEEDLKWDVFRSGGSGGQSVNTTDSAVRLTHLPTGLVVTCQNERSQLQNRQQALKTLQGKLVALQEKLHLQTIQELRGEHVQTSWGNQIRSYVLHPYQMVKDHRTDHETSQVDKVLDGDLDEFVEASLQSR